ncbi:hypothetical protein [Endozoicomonas sp. 8E]|uniref:hypothetical protein n=1 Tax=Endozoicomonas sp. 8E TaxID=3035692 RepID=UPI0029390332|nr:hypothetical protein [Endozoicomonas sp. 8E]WOG27622.1 hypothetical protein P6910_24250 [Endozoicomonas sp. 8E]
MISPFDAGNSSAKTDLAQELPETHRGTAMFALRRCGDHQRALRNICLNMTCLTLPPPPEHCTLLEGGKRLQKRTVDVSSSLQESTASRKLTEDSEAGPRAELEITRAELKRMHERIQGDYQRFCKLHKKFTEVMDLVEDTESALIKDFDFYYERVLLSHSEDDRENEFYRLQHEKAVLSRRNEQLEKELHQQNTVLDAKEKQLSDMQTTNVQLLRRLRAMHQRLTSKGADVVPKEALSQLQNDLRETQALLQEREDKVSARVANAAPRALSTDNQTAGMEPGPDEAR